jgi:hypothetical protein
VNDALAIIFKCPGNALTLTDLIDPTLGLAFARCERNGRNSVARRRTISNDMLSKRAGQPKAMANSLFPCYPSLWG